jgi:GMP synthase PP-ATPase subunit
LNTLKEAGLLVTKGKPPTTKYYIKRDEEIDELKKNIQIKLVAPLHVIWKNEKLLDMLGIYLGYTAILQYQ